MPKPLLAPIALALTALMVLSGCDEGLTAGDHVVRARERSARGDLSAAVIELKNALQKDPENAEARWFLGVAYLELGDHAGAAKELSRAAQKGSTDPELTRSLARALVLGRKYKEALELLDKAPADPPHAALLVLRGDARAGLGERDAARSAYQEALAADGTSVDARLGLASLAMRGGRAGEAQEQVARVLEQSPEEPRALVLDGELRLAERKPAEARASFERALAATGGRSDAARLGLARAKLAERDLDGAGAEIDRLRKAAPQDPLLSYLDAAVAYQRKDLSRAQGSLREVLRIAPDHLPSLLLLGTVNYTQGQLEQAEQHLARYVAGVPDNTAARKLLAAVRLARREPDRALEALAPIADPKSSDAQLLALLGSAYLRKGDPIRGSEYLERATELAPDVAALRTQLAITHLAAGETTQAVAELESAVELDQGLVQADILLVLAQLRDGKAEEAVADARRLTERQPDDPLAHNLLGAALLAHRDPTAARAAFEAALRAGPTFAPAALNLAQLDLREGKTAAAKARFESILTAHEHHPQALVGLARMAASEGNDGAAADFLDRARRHNPGALEPRVVLGGYYLAVNDPTRAREVVEEAVRLAPENRAVLTLQAQVSLATGQPAEAARIYARLIARGDATPDLYARLAAAELASGRRDDARRAFEQALDASEGKHAPALLGLGRLELAAGKPDAALKRAARLKTLYPDSPAGPTLEGDVLMAGKKPAEAAGAYDTALRKGGGTELVLRLAGARRAAGDASGAEQTLRDWATAHPDDIPVRIALASRLQEAGNIAGAAREYETLLREVPDQVVALNNLAWLYHETRDPRALELAERALKGAPDNPSIKDTAGWLRLQGGQVEQGLALLREAAAAAPRTAEIRYHLGAALARSGDTRTARRELDAALALPDQGPWRAEAQRLLDLLP
jgi:putative PEP-CTERM system TPR-repeat lipoprotein